MYLIILYFAFYVYYESAIIGSPSKMYELLEKAAVMRPVSGNAGGSYLTLSSDGAIIFGIINIIGIFVCVNRVVSTRDYL